MATVVETTHGSVAGRVEGSGRTQVRVFRGIPYAAAPVGARRFGPPVPAGSWRGVRDASAFGPGAPQSANPMSGLVPGMAVSDRSEDCLSLNVWTQADAGPLRPVLVWFHGGSFVIGSSSQPAYDGTRYASEHGTVLVTVNYRLGALGFLDARSLPGAGTEVVANCGLRDAIAALTWVQQNIEAFGGDPARVTVFGESAGGGIALHLCAAPSASGLFRAAIVQSGATFSTLDDERAQLVTTSLCGATGAADVDALQALPAEAVVSAQGQVAGEMLKPIGMMPFHPVVDNDVLPLAPREALAGGSLAGRALLLGTTSDEMRLFLPGGGSPPDEARVRTRIARYLGVDDAKAADVLQTYRRELGRREVGVADLDEVWATLFSDVEMQLPARAMLDAHVEHGPAWSYLFTWGAADPALGACHGIDIPFTFGTFATDGWDAFVGADDDATALSDRMRTAWSAFAAVGDPGWPAYRAGERKTQVFGRVDRVAADPLGPRLSCLVSSPP